MSEVKVILFSLSFFLRTEFQSWRHVKRSKKRGRTKNHLQKKNGSGEREERERSIFFPIFVSPSLACHSIKKQKN